MINRSDEKDQVIIVMRGLLLVYYNRMFASPIMCNSGIRIEDSINSGRLDKYEGKIDLCTWQENLWRFKLIGSMQSNEISISTTSFSESVSKSIKVDSQIQEAF
jgi:hypothetical protein